MINTYIISGFLGAGKTTFIQHLLTFNLGKVMLLENEFGEVGVDADFFDNSLAIKEINNGCICCSLQGDFAKALDEIAAYDIDTLLIEPSGVGKLSEIIPLLINHSDFRLLSHACIVNVMTAIKYHKNYKEFFDDQVIAANVLILSHNDVAKDKVGDVVKMLQDLNDEALIIEDPYALKKSELLDVLVSNVCACPECFKDVDMESLNILDHEHHHHHHHHHDGDEVFDALAFKTKRIYDEDELTGLFKDLDEDIIRVKGYVLSHDNKTLYFNYILNEYHLFAGPQKDEGLIVIIGSHLDHAKLEALFK